MRKWLRQENTKLKEENNALKDSLHITKYALSDLNYKVKDLENEKASLTTIPLKFYIKILISPMSTALNKRMQMSTYTTIA